MTYRRLLGESCWVTYIGGTRPTEGMVDREDPVGSAAESLHSQDVDISFRMVRGVR